MFGYVTICKSALSERGYNTFKAYYCGLCKAIGKRSSQSARMGLSYDITFLAMVLSSVGEEETQTRSIKCLLHPTRKNICVENDRAVDYAADMGIILSYLKLLDDWHDDRSIKALFSMALFYRGVKKTRTRYPEIYDGIRKCLSDLSALEKGNCGEIDETADCFAKILEILFTPDFIEDKDTKRVLAWLGYNIGRWIYIIDAYNDLEKDIKKKNYNTLARGGKTAEEIKTRIRDKLEMSMTLTLENAASAYDLLTPHRNKEVLDNIMYTALKAKQKHILGEKNESL
ncbi:MAG: DUF5685 family protein [Oscillospiraceae bacterium]|nr:DUF5685 family protein [Oscillospiraceae bacterium]